MANAKRSVRLGFVDLGADNRPKSGQPYPVIDAGSYKIGEIAYPQTPYKRLNLDLTSFYCNDMPDLLGSNEGMFKVSVNSRNPQNLSSKTGVAFVSRFSVSDNNYAPSFLYRGVYRNIIFQDFINLAFQLYELDTDAEIYYDKVTRILDGVPEIKSLDVLSGIPYLSLATRLFDGIIKTFGKNPDDEIWAEIPTLDIHPTPGGAFLRTGIYVIFERQNASRQEIRHEMLEYKDGGITTNSRVPLSNTLTVNLSLRPHHD